MIPDGQIIIPVSRSFGTGVSLTYTICSILRIGIGRKQLLPRREDDDAFDVNVMPLVEIILAEGSFAETTLMPPALLTSVQW